MSPSIIDSRKKAPSGKSPPRNRDWAARTPNCKHCFGNLPISGYPDTQIVDSSEPLRFTTFALATWRFRKRVSPSIVNSNKNGATERQATSKESSPRRQDLYLQALFGTYTHIKTYISQIVHSPLEKAPGNAQKLGWAFEDHCCGVIGGHWAFEIIARACFETTESSKSRLEQAFFSSTAFKNSALALLFLGWPWALEIMIWVASKPLGARNRCESNLFCIRQHSKKRTTDTVSNILPEITAHARSVATQRFEAM